MPAAVATARPPGAAGWAPEEGEEADFGWYTRRALCITVRLVPNGCCAMAAARAAEVRNRRKKMIAPSDTAAT